jgi:hypothetical protein
MNAREEFLSHIGTYYKQNLVLCAIVKIYVKQEFPTRPIYKYLTTGFTKEEWKEFLSDIDIEYNDKIIGFGSFGNTNQELYGCIWYKDGTWSNRRIEYTKECWEYHFLPEIPVELNRVDKVRNIKIDTILNIE